MTRRPTAKASLRYLSGRCVSLGACCLTPLLLSSPLQAAEPANHRTALVAPETVPSPAARAVAALIDEVTRVSEELSRLKGDLEAANADLETRSTDLQARIAAVEQSTNADLEALRQSLAGDLATLRDDLAAADESVAARAADALTEGLTRTAQTATAQIDAVSAELTAALAKPKPDVLARATALVLVAERALATNDLGAARASLARAERVVARDANLAAMIGPALGQMNDALAADTGEAAVMALQSALQVHCQRLQRLPARIAETPDTPMAAIRDAEPQSPAGWRAVITGLWRDLIGQVRVTPVDQYEARLGEGALRFAEVSLAGLCLSMQGALAARDGTRAAALADAMRAILDASFDPAAEPVEAFRETLSEVTALKITPWPSFDEVNRRLDDALIGSAATPPATAAPTASD